MTLCTGGACPQRRQCLRHRRRAAGRRATFSTPPYETASGRCASFVDVDTLAPTAEHIRVRAYHLWLLAGKPEGHDVAHWHQAASALVAEFQEGLTE